MFTREQSLEDDSMMTRTIVTITSLLLLWLPGITGHARHDIYNILMIINIMPKTTLLCRSINVRGAHVISIDVRSCVSVSVFTSSPESDTGQTVTRPGAWDTRIMARPS